MRIRDERSVGQKNNRRKSVEKDVVLAVGKLQVSQTWIIQKHVLTRFVIVV